MPYRIFGGNASQLHNHVHHLCHFALDIFHSSTRDHLPENRAIRFYLGAGLPTLHSMSAYFADLTETQAEAFHQRCRLVDVTSSTAPRQESKALAQRTATGSSSTWPPTLPQLVWSRFCLPASRAAAAPLKRDATPSRVRRKDVFVRPFKVFAALRAQRASSPAGALV
ncbi:hypothetical protein MGG_11092 [Pyricularia oryzae 70-15]|uniref:Uncharacterized protein n=2 Tax=Pyricularia oryzae TaxID=318829 RepID=G4MPZ6_PYRO7|nr:uncharacterized protein MGG_11092 [Pyricularia oryzae 70-15]EHA58084.1 hypothetical protein MGG_11092 [Pyricularia oryzae 70-15]KAI7908619.1 hypothetical protein M9X92_012090 [Pyricularia oryzae]